MLKMWKNVKLRYLFGLVIFLAILAVCFINYSSCFFQKPTTPPENSKVKLIPDTDKIYLGAFPDFGGDEDDVSIARLREFSALVGKNPVWVYFSWNLYKNEHLSKHNLEVIHNFGIIPFIRIMPRASTNEFVKPTKYKLIDIVQGKYDYIFKEAARTIKSLNYPVLIDFAVEPNGDWFPWSGVFNGAGETRNYGDPNYPDGPEVYRDAYRHVIDIFRENGVNNVTWFFHFNVESVPNEKWNLPKYYYPGDNYIDWIGFSAYGPLIPSDDWIELGSLIHKNIQRIKEVAQNKPVALLEFGVTDFYPGHSKSKWLENAFNYIKDNTDIRFNAIAYWNENWEGKNNEFAVLRLDSSREAFDTARHYLGNEKIFSNSLRFTGERGKAQDMHSIQQNHNFHFKINNWLDYQRYRLSITDSWYWQLDGDIDLDKQADIFDIDPYNTSPYHIRYLKAHNKFIVCYFSAGTYENWRYDKGKFPGDVVGKTLRDWPDERWLNITRFNQFKGIIENRITQLRQLGCNAIEADNIDVYNNDSGFNVTKKDAIKYIKWLSTYTHNQGMLFALKNGSDIVRDSEPYVDLAIVEECQKYNECNAYIPLIKKGKKVLAVEYDVPNAKVLSVCREFKKLDFIGGISCYDLNGCFTPCK